MMVVGKPEDRSDCGLASSVAPLAPSVVARQAQTENVGRNERNVRMESIMEELRERDESRQRRAGTPISKLQDVPRAPRHTKSEGPRDFKARLSRLGVSIAAKKQAQSEADLKSHVSEVSMARYKISTTNS